jgi:uncharacterized repeat protein (TIGR02543 family)
MHISTSTTGDRTQGEIWGAPLEAGTFDVKVKATDGTAHLLEDDEVTLTIKIVPELTEKWWPQLREDLIIEGCRLEDYKDPPINGTSIVEIYTTEPDNNPELEDKHIKINCEYKNFIALWIDGELMTEGDETTRTGDYFVNEGSTAITIYRKTLADIANNDEKYDPNKNHVIAAEFKEKRSADGEQSKVAQTFKIKEVKREYEITYNLNGGTNAASNPAKYTEGSATITLADPTKTGYKFAGWTPSNNIPSGSTGNRTFTAVWTKVEGLKNETGTNEPPVTSLNPNPGTDVTSDKPPKIDAPPVIQSRYYDVAITDWFYDDVEYVSEKGLMVGTGYKMFSPRIDMSRAMLVTVLYRQEGSPEVNSEFGVRNPKFNDIIENTWYYNAVIWAANNGIVEGYGNEIFGLNDPITREQTVTIFYRYAMMKEMDVSAAHDLSGYSDTDEITDWALDAMKWAVAKGIINGRTTTTIAPKGTSTRAEVAAIFKRYSKTFLPTGGED